MPESQTQATGCDPKIFLFYFLYLYISALVLVCAASFEFKENLVSVFRFCKKSLDAVRQSVTGGILEVGCCQCSRCPNFCKKTNEESQFASLPNSLI